MLINPVSIRVSRHHLELLTDLAASRAAKLSPNSQQAASLYNAIDAIRDAIAATERGA
jgi:hypothetical protein